MAIDIPNIDTTVITDLPKIIPIIDMATITEHKYGNVYNGIYLNRPATIVKENFHLVKGGRLDLEYVLKVLAKSGSEYTVYQSHICTMRQFINIKKHGYDVDDLKCTDDEKEAVRNTDLLDASGRHTPQSIVLLRDIVYAKAELKSKGFCHGNLTLDNIVLCLVGKELRAKVTRVMDGYDDDYKCLARVIDLLFSDAKGTIRSHEAEDLRRHVLQISGDYVVAQYKWRKHQVKAAQFFQEDPTTLFKHPIFWTDEQCLNFFVRTSAVIQKCWSQRSYWKLRDIKEFLDNIEAIGTSDWFEDLKDATQTGELKDDKGCLIYTNSKACDLLRFIRNMYCHFEEASGEFKGTVGELPEGFLEYFRRKFPKLLIETNRALTFSFQHLKMHVKISYQFKEHVLYGNPTSVTSLKSISSKVCQHQLPV